jgi:DNA-binding NarL/FixJ family response regulator
MSRQSLCHREPLSALPACCPQGRLPSVIGPRPGSSNAPAEKSLPYQIMLADAHPMFRRELKKSIEVATGLMVVGEAGNSRELFSRLPKSLPQMVILDISLPGVRNTEVINQLKTSFPEVKILVMAMVDSREYLRQTMCAGADGYLVKQDADLELLKAINALRRGETYLPPAASQPCPLNEEQILSELLLPNTQY